MLRVKSPETTVMSIQNEMHCNADARYAHRLHAVLMVAQGMSCVQVASVLGDSASAIQKWVKDYNRKGLSALHDAAIPGRPSRLSPEHMKKVESILRKSPKAAGLDCVIWDGKALSYWLKTSLGITLGVRQCQRIFRQIKFRYRKPRPRSAKADPVKQDEYKKNCRPSSSRI